MKGLQLVIRVNCFQRLHKSRGARRRITMGHAVDAPAVVSFDGNHESIVANSDQLVLDRFARLAHHAFQGAGYARAEYRDLVSNARQFGTGAIIYFPSWQNLVCDASAEAAQLNRKTFYQTPQHRRSV